MRNRDFWPAVDDDQIRRICFYVAVLLVTSLVAARLFSEPKVAPETLVEAPVSRSPIDGPGSASAFVEATTEESSGAEITLEPLPTYSSQDSSVTELPDYTSFVWVNNDDASDSASSSTSVNRVEFSADGRIHLYNGEVALLTMRSVGNRRLEVFRPDSSVVSYATRDLDGSFTIRDVQGQVTDHFHFVGIE